MSTEDKVNNAKLIPFQRFATCPKCGNEESDVDGKQFNRVFVPKGQFYSAFAGLLKWDDYLRMHCGVCGYRITMKPADAKAPVFTTPVREVNDL